MRILHLPTAVGGGPPGLSRQLKLLGFESEVWAIDQNYLDYPIDRVITQADDSLLLQMLKALKAGGYLFGQWDVVHFNYGSTLFSNGGKLLAMRGARPSAAGRLVAGVLGAVAAVLQRIELGVLRARRIPYFVHYQGDDARQGDYSLEHFEISIATQVPEGYYTPSSDAWKRRQIALMSRRASGIYAVNPDLLNVLPEGAVFVPYGHVPVTEWEPAFSQNDRERLVLAHAPSNRSVKGTELILAALEELAAEGYDFELDLVEGVSNAEALQRYRQADVLIDQLHAGWYGGVAVEAMALGKPVVVYLRESDFRHLPAGMAAELPFFQATPSTIKEALRSVLELPREALVARAKHSRAFVERWHDPQRIAAGIAQDYRRARQRSRRTGGGSR